MKKVTSKTSLVNRGIPAIVAIGTSLAAFPASALELGEVTVQSRLGQPLRASIAYALAPNEQLSDYCVTLRPGPSVSGLPGFGIASARVTNGVILLTGSTPVREPMVSAHVVVNCPYSASLSREYLLFIDPLLPAYDQGALTQQVEPAAEPIAIAATAVNRPVASPVTSSGSQAVSKDIPAATRYQVQAGDTVSGIAQRIQNRSIGLWPAVNAIFAANPEAFINNDPNRLKAGSWLAIPGFGGVTAAVEPVASSDSLSYEAQPEPVAAPVDVAEPVAAAEPAAIEEPTFIDEPVVDMTSDLRPGDVILDAELEGPITTSSSPNVPTAIIRTSNTVANGDASSSWLMWLAGSGIALIFGLLMFGRRFRGQADPAPAVQAAEQAPRRRYADTQKTDTESVAAISVDYDLTDDSPTEENLALDADLIIGTGLEHSDTSDVSQDFGYAASTDLDIELPFEPITPLVESTDMLPPLDSNKQFILDSEVLPESDDDYDMSVIVDATKMPQPEDVTERDLKAVEVVSAEDTLIAQDYTISKKVDFEVLEQDYEDELTATQALNVEIARATAELVVNKDNDEAGDDSATAALPLASVTELDITAQMPAQNDTAADFDNTSVNEEITVNTAADDETVEMPMETGKASS